jgi:hypothetical protein
MKSRQYSWMNPSIEIKDTKKYGKGLFAKDDIKKDTVLIVMGGYICNTNEENELGYLATNYNMDISEEWSFCPTKEEDILLMPQHLINHSCEPNTGFLDQMSMIAIKDIKNGEEIVYDYAFVMWSSDKSLIHFEEKCLCGTPSCRGVIKEDDWKIKNIQEKYGDYFQPFLKRKFKN